MIQDIVDFLRELQYCNLGNLMSMTHYQIHQSNQQVTYFEYDNESG